MGQKGRPIWPKNKGGKLKVNKKKTILIAIIVIIIIITIVGTIIFVNNQIKSSTNNKENENTKTSQLYEKISNAKEIIFTQMLDDNNKIFIAIKDDKGYKEVTTNGRAKKYIAKDGDTYYLDETNKKYYIYQSNDAILTEIKEQLEELKDITEISKGKEKINGKKYDYEEISKYQGFLFNEKLSVDNLEYSKTRLYYDNSQLVYIKTIAGDNEEIIKIDISYDNINNDYFSIPKEYSNGSQV